MKYSQLGKTSLKVSPICLGASQFDTGIERDFAFWQLDAFTAGGANFIDTARVYGDWLPGERARSEKLIGEWLKKSAKRDKVVIMTKGAHPLIESMEITRCTPEDIETDIEGSLISLGIEQIDLYLLHRDNPLLPVESLLEALEKARQKGKIKHYGFSNWQLSRVREAEAFSAKAGMEGFTCNQAKWSLAEVNAENIPDKSMTPVNRDTYRWHCDTGCALVAYNSTARGWFSKVESGAEISEKQRALYGNDANEKIYKKIKEAAGDLSLSVHNISLAYMRGHPFSSLPITSFSKKEQLDEALSSCETVLPEALINELNALKNLNL